MTAGNCHGRYIMRPDGIVIPEPDLMAWACWLEENDRHIGEDFIGDVRVSTVFLGLDYRFSSNGPPLLFETMIFGGDHDGFTHRYATHTEALQGHKLTVEMVKETR